jgi:cardiolipin synthase
VRLLKDGTENYPAWLDAIRGATRTIHFENYIFYEDDVGRQFAEALASRAREGVRVRLLQDWMGGLGKASRAFWRNLVKAGVEVRFFNPPRISNPFDWLHRDHRKLLSVDGSRAFVTGLCVGRMWAGDAARGVEPWRDTGVEILGRWPGRRCPRTSCSPAAMSRKPATPPCASSRTRPAPRPCSASISSWRRRHASGCG